jgi:hypothetical protein
MACCAPRVIVDPASTPSPTDDNVTYFLSSFQTQTGINLYQSNATLNTYTNMNSFVQTPYGLIRPDAGYTQSFYEIFPQPGTSTIRTACFNYVDSNSNASVRTFGFVKEFLSSPLVFVTPAYGTTGYVIPHIRNVLTTGVDYGMWDTVASNYTTDVAALSVRGLIDDRNSFISSNYDSNYYPIQGGSNFGSFITAGDLDPAYPATINWLFSYEYQSGGGPEFGTVLNTDIANINNGVAKSFPTFPPGSNPYPAYASYSSNAIFSVSLQPNTQYYVWWYIAYPEVMGNILSYLDITYTSKI